jgi:hypothetical protein
MKRRSFVITIVLGLLGIAAFPFIGLVRNNDKTKVLAQPKFLSLLCNRSTIGMLGRAYLKLKPDEGDERVLKDLLVDNSLKISLDKQQDISTIESHIEKRIKNDFDSNTIIVVEGWVLSITEARQCAFYSIING